MRSLFVPFVLPLAAGVLPAQTVQAPFSAVYSIANIGSVPGIPFAYYYGALVFDRDDPNTLLVSRWNASTAGWPAITPVRRAPDCRCPS